MELTVDLGADKKSPLYHFNNFRALQNDLWNNKTCFLLASNIPYTFLNAFKSNYGYLDHHNKIKKKSCQALSAT